MNKNRVQKIVVLTFALVLFSAFLFYKYKTVSNPEIDNKIHPSNTVVDKENSIDSITVMEDTNSLNEEVPIDYNFSSSKSAVILSDKDLKFLRATSSKSTVNLIDYEGFKSTFEIKTESKHRVSEIDSVLGGMAPKK